MSDSTIAKGPANTGQLFGFAIKAPEKPRRKKPARKPPLRICGERHWPEVCAKCLELEPPAWVRNSAQLSELPGETFEDLFGGAA